MAKKIKVAFHDKASETLKRNKIEHVLVVYKHEDHDDAFLVVQNKYLHEAKAALLADNISVLRIKNVRHYKDMALRHNHYQPTFECICRNCGKKFEHPVKEAVWCCKECKKEFRDKKRAAKVVQ